MARRCLRHATFWVCPHDPFGTDRDTGTYCPQRQRIVVPVYSDPEHPGYATVQWSEGVLASG